MRKTIVFLLISIGVNSQFNYQALIKHSSGQIISNNQVKVKFTLMYVTSSVSPVYEEEHIVNIPVDGVVNLSVGGGTVVNGTFSDIDWSQSVFMKEEIDTGSGYQNMGTKQIASVPLAEFAKSLSGFESDEVSDNIKIGDGSLLSVTSASSNIAIGKSALSSNTTGNSNIAIGIMSLKDNIQGFTNIGIGEMSLSSNVSGVTNIGIGYSSLRNNQANNNVGIGNSSLGTNVSGEENVAVGSSSLFSNKADGNTAVGYQSLVFNSTGFNNTALGRNALVSNITGYANTAIGENSMYNNESGEENAAIGGVSLYSNVDGNANIAVGQGALYYNTSGSENAALGYNSLNNIEENYNTAVGSYAGTSLISGTLNTALGYRSDIANNLTNATAIGANATVTASNTIQLGNTDVTLVNTSGVVSAAGLNIGGTAITSTASELNLLDGVSEIGVLASISENNNTGVRLSSSNSSNHGDIGGDAVDLSKQGQSSSIRGATGYGSFASGYNTTASEYYSTALGSYTVASGYGSTATGRYTTASGYYSVTMGNSTTASDWGSLVIGRYNLSSSSATSADSFSTSNPAFVIGNGSASSARSDAFKVMYNGDTTTSGIVSATGFKGSGDQLTLNDNGTITSLMQLIGDLKSEISALQQSNNSEIKSAQVKTNTSNDVVLFELGVLRFSWNTTYNTIQVKQSSSSEIVDNWFISGVIRSGGSSGEYSPNETYIQKSNMTYGLGDGGGYNDRFTPIWSDGFTSLMEGSIALGSTYSNFEFYITPMGSGSSTQYDPVPTWQLRGHVDGYGQLTVTCIHAKFDGNSGW